MEVLVDAGAGKAVADALRALGHDVAEARDLGPGTPDLDILAHAVREGRLVLTMDKDFGDLVYRSRLPHAGILLLRLRDESVASKVAATRAVFEKYGDGLAGRFSVYRDGRFRIR